MLPETNSAQSEVLTNRLTKSGYKLYTFPACTNALITEFPNYTGISLFLANWRILPEIKRIMNKVSLYSSSYTLPPSPSPQWRSQTSSSTWAHLGHSSNSPTPKALNYRGLSFSYRGLAPAGPPPGYATASPPETRLHSGGINGI